MHPPWSGSPVRQNHPQTPRRLRLLGAGQRSAMGTPDPRTPVLGAASGLNGRHKPFDRAGQREVHRELPSVGVLSLAWEPSLELPGAFVT